MDRLLKTLRLFPRSFWWAIVIELLHCLASYSMMAYLVIYWRRTWASERRGPVSLWHDVLHGVLPADLHRRCG